MTTLYGGVTYTQGQGNTNQVPLTNLAERAPSTQELFQRNNDKLSRDIRCAIPAQVVSFNAEKQTVEAQPLIREKLVDRQTGTISFVPLPVLVDIPVCFPQAGNFVLTMPVQPGDEVLLVFSDNNIDSWWEAGGIQNWNDRRRHDLSDAIAVVGLNSVPNVIPNISAVGAELRSKDGTMKVSIEEGALFDLPTQTVTLTTLGASITLKTTYIEVLGVPVTQNRIDITGDLYINGQAYTAHTHHVTTAPGTTGGVNP